MSFDCAVARVWRAREGEQMGWQHSDDCGGLELLLPPAPNAYQNNSFMNKNQLMR